MQKSKSSQAISSFEESMQELENLVHNMESGSLSLEQSLQNYQRGTELLKHCQSALERVREQVRILDGDNLKTLDHLTDLPNHS